MQKPKICLVDENPFSRQGLKQALETDFEVVYEAASTDEFHLRSSNPVQADVGLMNLDGLPDPRDKVSKLHGVLGEGVPIVGYASTEERIDELAHQGVPVSGILETTSDGSTFRNALHLVIAGSRVFPARMAREFIFHPRVYDETDPQNVASRDLPKLSERERAILSCLVTGDSNKNIAARLGITEATVKVHLKNIQRKINKRNRTQAAIWALDHGLAPGGSRVKQDPV